MKIKLPFFLFALLFTVFAKAQYNVVVAKDGSGDFTTVQAAINAAPAGQTTPYKIFIKKGKYREQVNIPASKPFLELIGEDVATTVISYGDGGGGTTTVTINANDCMMMNITMENTQGYLSDGPQSLAVKTNNADRVAFKNCRFISGQDTVFVNGKRVYFRNCYVDGNTDFVYGAAVAVFDTCVIYPRDRVDGSAGGYVTAANTPNGQAYGLVFRDCIMPNNRGITNYTLGRPWQNDGGSASPAYNKTVFLNTVMSKSITPAGWSVWDAGTNTSTITYAEFQSRKFDGSLVDISQRVSWSQQLTPAQAAPYYVNANLFGTWDPYAVWADLAGPVTKVIALANLRALRSSSGSTIPFNICWPISNVKYELHRSTDSVNFTKINEFTIADDTTAAYFFTDVLPPSGTSYFYKVIASKAGYSTFVTDTIVKVNINIPLNGDYKSIASGGWTNNVSAISTISGGAVTGVTITSSPAGYTGVPTVTFAAAPSGGTTATGTAVVTGGVVTGVNITTPGSGYTSAPSVTFSTSGVGGNSIWQRYSTSTNSWEAVALGSGPSNANVTITSGHTVSLNALAGITALTIENGGVFQTDGQSRNFRVKGDVNNNGVFGGTNTAVNKLTLELDGTSGTYNIGGTGVYNFVTMRALTAVQALTVNINANLTMSGNLQAWYASGTATDQGANNVVMNISNGYTVTAAALHGTAATNTSATYGNYTYNINGILDLSAGTALTGLIPNATATSSKVLTLNVNGILRTSTQFRTVSTSPGAAESKVVLNIGPAGLLDASKATTFALGSNYFIVSGNGVLKRNVGATATSFAIGTSATSYSPVTLTNSGPADNFSVGVKSSFTNPIPNPARAVGKEWNITAENGTGANVAASFGWVAADQGASFVPGTSLLVARHNGSLWAGTSAPAASGAGTIASPYTTSAAGFTNFGYFAVTNEEALPVTLVSFGAALVANGVDVRWTTVTERSFSHFEVEKSNDAAAFAAIGKIKAHNTAGTNQYNFTDGYMPAGTAYYRLKMYNADGSFSYSKVVAVNSKLNGQLAIFPNPARAAVTVNHTNAGNDATIEIFALNGSRLMVVPVQAGATQTALDISKLAKANYRLVFVNGKAQTALSFIKH